MEDIFLEEELQKLLNSQTAMLDFLKSRVADAADDVYIPWKGLVESIFRHGVQVGKQIGYYEMHKFVVGKTGRLLVTSIDREDINVV